MKNCESGGAPHGAAARFFWSIQGGEMARRKLVVIGGRKPQMRKASKRSWTQAKAREFLSALG